MKLLSRYLLREHVPPFVFALAALTGLMLLNQVAQKFGQLVGKGLTWGVILEFFALSVPFIVAMTLPMAVLVAVLYAFVRLGADNEITALRASGVNLVTLVRPVLLAALGLTVISFLFIDHVLPRTNHKLAALMIDIARKRPTFQLKEQMVNEVIQGQYYLKANRINQATDRLKDVVIFDLTGDTRRRTIYADSGYMAFNADRTVLLLTLFDGYVHDYDRAQPDVFRRVDYRTDLVKVHGVSNTFERTGEDSYKGDREMSTCEMDSALQGQLASIASVDRDRDVALANDVHRLLGVPTPNAFDAVTVRRPRPLAAAHLYCGALQGLLFRLLRPRPLAAQEPGRRPAAVARTPAARAPAAMDSLRRFVGLPSASGAAAAAAPAAQPPRRYVPDTSGSLLRATLASLDARRRGALQLAARYEIEMHKKFAIAASCLVFVLIGAPIALRFPRGGVGLVIGASVVIFGLYYVGLIGGETLANELIVTPFWAMWGANLLMTTIGVALFLRLNRQRVAARGAWRERLGALRDRWRAAAERAGR
ncbi:MAG TPA: LptF/LptG family permease [Gemmatimonadales bacterium]|nr:LptF/LptG family permease [Gemmatimonadales bacterium]